MAILSYRGRNPDSDGTIVPKSYADSSQAVLAVTTTVVNNLINTTAANLVLPSYVDQQDALYAKKTAVTTADANYLPTTALGAASGVGQLDSGGNVPVGQLPAGLLTDRVFKCYPGQLLLSSGVQHQVTTTGLREFQLGACVIPDPGYPWRPWPFAWVQGNAGGTSPGTRQQGNGNYGLLTVMPPSGVSDQVYGVGICTASLAPDLYALTPHAGLNQTHVSVPAVTGGLELDLFGCCFSGNNFVFGGTNLSFFVLVIPSL